MFDVILDYLKRFFKSRLFPIAVVYILLLAVIINQLFIIQIVNGPEIVVTNELRDTKQRSINTSRGNIYDRNGILLATNEVSFSVVMEDLTINDTDYNSIIHKLIYLIEKNGDSLDNEFFIKRTGEGQFEFTVSDGALTRFKKKVYELVNGGEKDLTEEQQQADANEVFNFLRNGIKNFPMFQISEEYTEEEALKIMGVRYVLYCVYPKYLQISIASHVSDETIAAVKENREELQGVEIQKQTSRHYEYSEYFAHIIGYTGKMSAEEWDSKYEALDGYTETDIVGKTGLEYSFQDVLVGKKGFETVTVNSNNRVIGIVDSTAPQPGNDIYLTLDANLQKNAYLLLEKEITNILLDSIVPTMNYGSKGESATDITLPIFEVYNALINNNIIDTTAFVDSDATSLEKETQAKYNSALTDVFARLDEYLDYQNTITNDKAGDMEDFLNYFYSIISTNKILIKKNIPENDTTYAAYQNHNLSLAKFLQHAIANNWIDLAALKVGDEFNTSEELYQKLINHVKEKLKDDGTFNKMIYRNLIFSYKLSGTEICLLLFDQGVLEYKESEVNALNNGTISAYDFLTGKIETLAITPAMLALEPCSGSVVITDVNNGDVLALVSYPSYDNNRLADKADSEYFVKLLNDKSSPLYSNATKSTLAPGSTFKMVTSVAALEEGVTTPTERILDLGEFDKISPAPKCHIFPGSHGSVDIVDALKVSCNYYFFEMAWRLSKDSVGLYKPDIGLSKLEQYAALFGLNEKSGIELTDEKAPQTSNKDAIRSAIGQGTNDYTPVQLARYVTTIANRGTCYDLTLIDKIENKEGTVIEDNSAEISHELTDVKESTWDAVFEGMYAVANVDRGSVVNDFKNFSVTVAGKTGTSQISKSHPNNALFVSFAPYEAPTISVTSVIPRGYTSHNAANLSKKIYSLYFDKTDVNTLLNGNNDANTNSGSAIE